MRLVVAYLPFKKKFTSNFFIRLNGFDFAPTFHNERHVDFDTDGVESLSEANDLTINWNVGIYEHYLKALLGQRCILQTRCKSGTVPMTVIDNG